MSEGILPIPPIPSGLREAAQRGSLIPFIGAGVSRIAGCPSWSEFADGALRCLVEDGNFSHKQLDQIGHLNPRVKLSIALGLERNWRLVLIFGSYYTRQGKKIMPRGRSYLELFASWEKHSSRLTMMNG